MNDPYEDPSERSPEGKLLALTIVIGVLVGGAFGIPTYGLFSIGNVGLMGLGMILAVGIYAAIIALSPSRPLTDDRKPPP